MSHTPRLARRQYRVWLPLTVLAGVASLATSPLIDGAWMLMLAVAALAITDTHTTTRRNHP